MADQADELERLSLQLAGHGLTSRPLDPDGWSAHIDALSARGLGRALVGAVIRGQARLSAPDLVRLDELTVSISARTLRLEALLDQIAEPLSAVGGLLLGGPAVARSLYDEASARPYSELEVLIPAGWGGEFVGSLLGAGITFTTLTAAHDAVQAIELDPGSGRVLKVHDRLPTVPPRDVDTAPLFAQPRTIESRDAILSAPSWEAQLVLSAIELGTAPRARYHLVLRDLASILTTRAFDPARCADLADRMEVSDELAEALDALTGLGVEFDRAAFETRPVDRAEPPARIADPAPAAAPSRPVEPITASLGARFALDQDAPVPTRPAAVEVPDPEPELEPYELEPYIDEDLAEWVPEGRPVPVSVAHSREGRRLGPSLALVSVAALAGFWVAASAMVEGDSDVYAPIVVLMFGGGLSLVAIRRLAERHPEEPWLFRWLFVGFGAKMGGSLLRYLALVVAYDGAGDASRYDLVGTRVARSIAQDSPAPSFDSYTGTAFIEYLTGLIYTVTSPSMLAGFFVFSIAAYWGSYLWFRGAASAIPGLRRRLCLGLLLFAPSMVFWPSSIGKEAVMQLGIGLLAYGASLVLRRRLAPGLTASLAGGWVLFMVRPHLLAMVTLAVAVAYFLGSHERTERLKDTAIVGRLVGILAVVVLSVFTVMEAQEFLDIDEISTAAIEQRLDEQTRRTSQGGSQFDTPDQGLTPAALPVGFVTVILRPFPWEAGSAFMLIASAEGVLLAGLLLARLGPMIRAVRSWRRYPFVMYCSVLVVLYSLTFSSFANFGLLARQRSLALPALFVLLAVDIARGRPAAPPYAAYAA